MDNATPLPSSRCFVDTLHGTVRCPSSPASGTCAEAPNTNASFWEFSEVQLEHHSNTLYMVGGNTGDVAWGSAQRCFAPTQNLAKEVNARYGNHTNLYTRCPRMQCFHLSENGSPCLQVITCATVSEHFAGHGVKGKCRMDDILCNWAECAQHHKRHNFVRHVREAHLGHQRGSTNHRCAEKPRTSGSTNLGYE
ncbi:hypothetical protein EDC04DRAFT_2751741 [Pisolithus marmoratus]|nr:hypothetical protein EDC04DRAFT_2751741 [Pisolithus marmoratus]